MIRLDLTTRKLQIGFDTSVSAGVACVVSFVDTNNEGNPTAGGTQATSGAGIADLDICAAPRQSFVRNIDTVTIFNPDSATHVLTIKIDDGGTDTILLKQSLAQNKTLAYGDSSGWQVL